MKLKFITVFLTLLSSVAYGSYPCKIRFKSSITLTNATITILKNDIIGVVESRKLAIADGTVYNLDINQPVVIASLSGIYKNKPYFSKFLLDSGDNQLLIEPSFKNFNVLNTSISNLLYNKYEAILKGGTYSTNGVTSNLEQTFDNCLKYINDNKSYVTLIALYQLSKMEADRKSSEAVLKVLNQLPPELKSTSLANEILEREQRIIRGKERASKGMVVPSFSVPNLKGEMISNSSLAGKNYVIAFSATWCGPCQTQLPKLKRIYEQYRKYGLEVIYYNEDDDIVKWKQHVLKNKLDWINVSDRKKPKDSPMPKQFGIYAVPSYLIVNKVGHIVYNSDQEDVGLLKFESSIRDLLHLN